MQYTSRAVIVLGGQVLFGLLLEVFLVVLMVSLVKWRLTYLEVDPDDIELVDLTDEVTQMALHEGYTQSDLNKIRDRLERPRRYHRYEACDYDRKHELHPV